MKGLKFRVWDIASECYLPVTRSSDDGVLGITIDRTGIIYMEDGEVNVQLAGDSDVIIEQYTGLKDNNGKEIYERDIVRVSYGYNYKVWQSRTGAWRIGRDDLCVWADSSEVIGNIHENLELLGGEE